MHATKWMIGTALLTLSAGAFAGETGGTFMSFVRSASESQLPDGNRARVMHYHHASTSDKADSPFAGKTSECIGRMIVTAAGKVASGSGFCFAQDAAGNGGSWSWKIEQAGTASCPIACGTFKWVEGYGKTSKVTASGSWKQTQSTKDGNIGTYTVTYTP